MNFTYQKRNPSLYSIYIMVPNAPYMLSIKYSYLNNATLWLYVCLFHKCSASSPCLRTKVLNLCHTFAAFCYITQRDPVEFIVNNILLTLSFSHWNKLNVLLHFSQTFWCMPFLRNNWKTFLELWKMYTNVYILVLLYPPIGVYDALNLDVLPSVHTLKNLYIFKQPKTPQCVFGNMP